MAEKKCPLCSTMNPGDADVCRNCGARLLSPEEIEGLGKGSQERNDLFSDLRQEGGVSGESIQGGFEPDESGPDEENKGPDWLKRIRQLSSQEESPSAEDLLGSEDDEVPDWMQALAAADKAEISEEPEEEKITPAFTLDQGDEPDQSGEVSAEIQANLPEEELSTKNPAETPDWLAEMENWTQSVEKEDTGSSWGEEPEIKTSEDSDELQPQDEDAIPEWLRAINPHSEIEPESDEEAEELEQERELESDFLRSLSESGEEEESSPAQQEETAPENVKPDDDLVDWLASFEEETFLQGQEIQTETSIPEDEISEAPEVLREEPETAAASPEEESLSIPELEDEAPGVIELPEIASLSAEESAEIQEPPEEDMPEGETEGIPDWMWSPEETQLEPSAEEEALLDWLDEGGAGKTDVSQADEESEVESAFEPGVLPDWLLDDEPAAPESVQGSVDEQPEMPVPEAAEESPEIVDLSEWLGDISLDEPAAVFETRDQMEDEAGEMASTTPPFFREDLQTWIEEDDELETTEQPLQEMETNETPQPVEAQTELDLPDWLDEGAEDRLDESAGDPEVLREEPAETERISQADLPDWLAAMRPIESVLPEVELVDDKKVEQAGPLAGLRGVLPVQDASTHYRKPPVYSLKLQVTEKQRAHAVMFENMMEEEQRAISARRGARRSPQRLLRAALGLLLFAAILLPLLGIPPAGVKVGQVANVTGFYDAVEALPEGSSALVAVDYAPGYSGEMKFAASGVLQRLMSRGVRIAVVSTLPSGPVLAEGLKMQALADWPDLQTQYDQRDWYINLGYLPGETISLQELAHNPHQAFKYGISAGLDNHLVWDSGVLQNIQTLSDFEAIILVTDTVETGKTWIEQVQPGLVETPLLLVSSAQSAPMLQPYLQSGQIQGLISGMAGGISYEEATLNPNADRSELWLANQFGLGAAILIFLIGVIIESISSLAGRNRPDQEV